MIRSAYLQELGDHRRDVEVKAVAEELDRRQIPYKYFLEKNCRRNQLPFAADTLVVGHIPVIHSALRQLGIQPPPANDYPECLRPWLHRHMWASTVGKIVAILQEGTGDPFFVKPVMEGKRLRGHVVAAWGDLAALAKAPDSALVYCSEVVNWKSEYRVFVYGGSIAGMRFYKGDDAVQIDQREVEKAIKCLENSGSAPAGYSVDFGVLSTGQTAFIEFNDGYSLGAYGLEPKQYTDLLVARWCQLTKNILSP